MSENLLYTLTADTEMKHWYNTNIFNVPYFPFHNLATLVMMMTGLNDSSNLRLQFHKMLIKCKTYKEIVQKEHSDFIIHQSLYIYIQ